MLSGAAGGVRALARNIFPGSAHSTSDIRPLPNRPRLRYAGCMLGAPAIPIDSVYSSVLTHRKDLWEREATCKPMRLLLPCSQEAVYGHENAFQQGNKNLKQRVPLTRRIPNKDLKSEGR